MQWLAKATDLKLAIEGLGAGKSCCRTFSSLKIEKREEGIVQNTFFLWILEAPPPPFSRLILWFWAVMPSARYSALGFITLCDLIFITQLAVVLVSHPVFL